MTRLVRAEELRPAHPHVVRLGVVVGVANANLSVARGEISVLMGLSGSGKSTLLRAANGLNAQGEPVMGLQ